jgi:hypothetical protein
MFGIMYDFKTGPIHNRPDTHCCTAHARTQPFKPSKMHSGLPKCF